MTPRIFSVSSTLGPAMAGPHSAASSGLPVFAMIDVIALFAGIARYTAARPPQPKALSMRNDST